MPVSIRGTPRLASSCPAKAALSMTSVSFAGFPDAPIFSAARAQLGWRKVRGDAPPSRRAPGLITRIPAQRAQRAGVLRPIGAPRRHSGSLSRGLSDRAPPGAVHAPEKKLAAAGKRLRSALPPASPSNSPPRLRCAQHPTHLKFYPLGVVIPRNPPSFEPNHLVLARSQQGKAKGTSGDNVRRPTRASRASAPQNGLKRTIRAKDPPCRMVGAAGVGGGSAGGGQARQASPS